MKNILKILYKDYSKGKFGCDRLYFIIIILSAFIDLFLSFLIDLHIPFIILPLMFIIFHGRLLNKFCTNQFSNKCERCKLWDCCRKK